MAHNIPPPVALPLGFAGDVGGSSNRPHLSVDGMTPAGPNLSHWPGNRTPHQWKADLSTGICMRFMRATPADRASFLADTEVVLNDHYDTDGFCSLLTILKPQAAFEHEETWLAAAACGDFQVFTTPRAFAIDRTILRLSQAASPVASEFANLSGPEKSLARYRWLLDNADRLLTNIEFEPLWRDELDTVLAQLDSGLRGEGIRVQRFRDEGLAVITTDAAMHRMALNTLAGVSRVLHIQRAEQGQSIVRYHDRTESWFELVSIQPPLRRDLRPLADRLQEQQQRTGSDDTPRWTADAPTQPIPELYFGIPSEQAYGEVSRELLPTMLPVDSIIDTVRDYLRTAPPAQGVSRAAP